jgi:hypothetical protein
MTASGRKRTSEPEAGLEDIRRDNDEGRGVHPESPLSRGQSRGGVLADEDDLHRKHQSASGG